MFLRAAAFIMGRQSKVEGPPEPLFERTKMRYWSFVTSFLAVFLVAAEPPDANQAKKDLDKLQGIWTLVQMEAEGKKLPEDAYKGVKVTFDKDKMAMGKDNQIETATIVLDLSKQPKWIDTTSKDGDVLQGIYQLEGDDLKICLSKKRGDRPKEFVTKSDREDSLLILKRQKK
jgi:uncharacterized protein (TIGR03067 family)